MCLPSLFSSELNLKHHLHQVDTNGVWLWRSLSRLFSIPLPLWENQINWLLIKCLGAKAYTMMVNIHFIILGSPWHHPSLIFNLIIFIILKFIFCVLSLSLPCPNGIFLPLFSFGSVIGRFYGVILSEIGNLIGVKIIQY